MPDTTTDEYRESHFPTITGYIADWVFPEGTDLPAIETHLANLETALVSLFRNNMPYDLLRMTMGSIFDNAVDLAFDDEFADDYNEYALHPQHPTYDGSETF